MKTRRLQRKLRQLEQQRIDAFEQAQRDFEILFVRESIADNELTTLTRPLVELQLKHGVYSPEADAEIERIRPEFERIVEERYPWVFDGLEEEAAWRKRTAAIASV